MQRLILYGISYLLLYSSFSVSARAEMDMDSLMFNMPHLEKLESLIWVEISSLDDIEASQSHAHFYLADSVDLGDELKALNNMTLAKALDESLNPSSTMNLPDLAHLAAINEKKILSEYFYHLRAVGQFLNYQYLILPESSNPRKKDLLKSLHDFDSSYFIEKKVIAQGIPTKKKEIKSLFNSYDFWLISKAEYPEVMRKIEKLDGKILLGEKDGLARAALDKKFNWKLFSQPLLTQKQQITIKQTAVALIEKESWFPLDQDTVCFLSENPYGALGNMLRNYAYVITDQDEALKSEAPIIADYVPFLPEFLTNRAVVYIGEIEGFDQDFFNAALIIPKEDEAYQYLLPQQIFGSSPVSGAITSRYELYDQFESRILKSRKILSFAPPESVGINQVHLDAIEDIIDDGILQKAFPGCQLAIAVNGSIVLDQTFGHLTYDKLIPVYPSTLFDLASITKVAGTLMMTMKLFDEGKLNLDQSISHYLPKYEISNKKEISIKSLLAHQAGLLPYIPFWKRVLSADFLDPFYYASADEERLDQRSYGVGTGSLLKDSLSQWILTSPLLKYDSVPHYSYSDIGFLILQEVLETIADQSMDQYLKNQFFEPLSLERISYNPKRAGVDLFEIAPTEYDNYYRSEQIWGEVHDRNAAILDGVAGHAGLFSNAGDMLVLFQMILQGGNYNGKQFFSEHTLSVFNQRYFPENRRGLGWDKKSESIGNTSSLASDESFGHTGFTGTMVWVDPEYDLVFVFLTNRIHPSVNNRKLNELDIRTRIQDVVYEAIVAKKQKQNYFFDFGVNP